MASTDRESLTVVWGGTSSGVQGPGKGIMGETPEADSFLGSLYAVARPSVVCLSVCLSVVCNVRAPYSAG